MGRLQDSLVGRSWFSPSTIWGSEIELRMAGLVAGTSTFWVISPAPLPSYYMYYFISSPFTSDRRACGPMLHHPSLLTLSYTKAHGSVRPHYVDTCYLTTVRSFQHPNYRFNMGALKNKVRTKVVESLVS